MPEWLSTTLDTVLRVGVLGALVAFILRELLDWRRRRRERRGLLTILDLETEQNERQFQAYEDDIDWITSAPSETLRTKGWEETRVRLSQLVPANEYADLLKYYEGVRVINVARLDFEKDAGLVVTSYDKTRIQKVVRQGLPQLREQNTLARRHIRKYVPEEALNGTPLGNLSFDRDPYR